MLGVSFLVRLRNQWDSRAEFPVEEETTLDLDLERTRYGLWSNADCDESFSETAMVEDEIAFQACQEFAQIVE